MTRLHSNSKEKSCSNHKVVKYAVTQFLPQSLYFETRNPASRCTFRSSLTTGSRTDGRTYAWNDVGGPTPPEIIWGLADRTGFSSPKAGIPESPVRK